MNDLQIKSIVSTETSACVGGLKYKTLDGVMTSHGLES